MKIYRVVVEWPNRTNPLDRILSEIFESEEAARQYVRGFREDQEMYGLEPGETLRLEIYDLAPAVVEFATYEKEDEA
jgi:hypothetical protein